MILLGNSAGELMKRFVVGRIREQSTLLPECLDDFVGENNPVRVIDAFVDALDLAELGFDGMEPAATERPSYHPSTHLKLYIYGYLYRVQSSRRLEREAGRNVEVMWLCGASPLITKPSPTSARTTARRCAKCVRASSNCAARWGCWRRPASRLTAANSKRSIIVTKTSRRRKWSVGASNWKNVARYLAQLDTADLQEPSETIMLTKTRLKEKLAKLDEEMKRLAAIEKQMLASPDRQISLTDPDSRSMATSGRGSGVVGYNVQTAVDTENHLIVTHEVTNRARIAHNLRA